MPEMMLETLQIDIPPMAVWALFFYRGTHGVSCSVIYIQFNCIKNAINLVVGEVIWYG
jgi:hypothetical protein